LYSIIYLTARSKSGHFIERPCGFSCFGSCILSLPFNVISQGRAQLGLLLDYDQITGLDILFTLFETSCLNMDDKPTKTPHFGRYRSKLRWSGNSSSYSCANLTTSLRNCTSVVWNNWLGKMEGILSPFGHWTPSLCNLSVPSLTTLVNEEQSNEGFKNHFLNLFYAIFWRTKLNKNKTRNGLILCIRETFNPEHNSDYHTITRRLPRGRTKHIINSSQSPEVPNINLNSSIFNPRFYYFIQNLSLFEEV
jgi:hypothetical protein